MHPFLDTIRERPTGQKIGLWAGSLLIPLLLFWQLVYKGLSVEVTKLKDRDDQLEAQIVKEQRLTRDIKKVKGEVEKLEGKLKAALAELPDQKEIPTLLTSISGLAKDAGLEVQLFKPEAESPREFFAEVPVSIQVAGAYHKVATFFDEVSKLERIVNIGQLRMTEPKLQDSEVKLTTNCVATTFRYLEESERVKTEEQGKRGGRRK